jgi:hypothetical protein
MRANDRVICELVSDSLVSAHDKYLEMSGYGALDIPESYLASFAADVIHNVYGRKLIVRLEASFASIGVAAKNLRRKRIDIVILRKFLHKSPRLSYVVELKKSGSVAGIKADIKRLATVIKQIPNTKCIMACYHIGKFSDAVMEDTLDSLKDTMWIDGISCEALDSGQYATIRKGGTKTTYQVTIFFLKNGTWNVDEN